MSAKLSALLQKAGHSLYTASQSLQAATQAYALQAPRAMATAPFALETDNLLDSWKACARLSAEVAMLEERMRELFAQSQANQEAAPALAPLSLPSVTMDTATDVTPKAQKKTRAAKAGKKNSKKTAKTKAQLKAEAAPRATKLSANTQRLLELLQKTLNANAFTPVNMSAAANSAGLPLGSITYAFKRLVELGLVEAGARGEFKLGTATA